MNSPWISRVFWLGTIFWLLAAVSTIWFWGGAKQNRQGLIAAGAFALAIGTLCIHVVAINVFARMDNAYLSNGVLGAYLIVAGVLLTIGGLVGYGVPNWVAVLLWVVSAAAAVYGIPAITRTVHFPDSGLLLSIAFVLGGSLIYLVLRGYMLDAVFCVAFASVAAILAWGIYGAGTRAFVPVESLDAQVVKPPVLEPGVFVFCLLLSTGLFFTGRAIQRWRQSRPPSTDVVVSQ